MSKLQEYVDKQTQIMIKMFPDKDPELIRQQVIEITQEYDRPKETVKITVYVPNKGKVYDNTSLASLEKKLDKDKPIITRYGTCFQRQDEFEAILAQMLAYMSVRRKKAKNEMLDHVNDEDQTIYNMLDMIQKTIKILMNSYYGVLTAKGSIFRNLDCGESITHSGELIIMTAISIFERFLTNNIRFYSVSDMINYCDNIVNEVYESEEDFEIGFEKEIDVDFVVKYLYSHLADIETVKNVSVDKNNYSEALYKYLNNIDEEYLYKIYYKNNLKAFFEDAYICPEDKEAFIFLKEFEGVFKTIFLNPNKPNEEQQVFLDNIWSILRDWVFYNYQNSYKYNECKTGSRRTVTIVDTDSNILYLGAFYMFFKNMFPEIIDGSREKKVTTINTITYPLTNVINDTYLNLTKYCNIPESHRPLINMKNEFMFDKVLLTKNKKSYATSTMMKEGRLLEKSKIEVKGMKIKKSDTNKSVRKFFNKLLEEDILSAEYIDYPKIIRKYFEFSDVIKDSLTSGSAEFGVPGNCNEISGYENPYNVMSVRGALLWNILFPDEEIRFPNKVHMYKLSIGCNIEEFEQYVRDYFEEHEMEIDEKDFKKFLGRMEEAMNESKLYKSGIISVISAPKTLSKIPIYLMPFLRIDEIVLDNLNSGTILLDSLGIQTPKINLKLMPTNIIKI